MRRYGIFSISTLLSLCHHRPLRHAVTTTTVWYSTMAKIDHKQAALDFLSFVNASPTRNADPTSPACAIV